MKSTSTLLLILLIFSTCLAQTDTTTFGINLTMSPEDYEYIKTIIKEDVINWCNNRDEKFEANFWKMLLVRDTVILVTIETDSGNFEIDIIDEFQRRAVGGWAGSYPFVETWDFKVSEEELIEIIKQIKLENPEFQIPGDTNLTSGRRSYWFYIEFFDKDNNETISTWIRGGKKSSSLALISYRERIDEEFDYPGRGTKLINRDFWKIENDNRINKFEAMIIDKIKEALKQKNASKYDDK